MKTKSFSIALLCTLIVSYSSANFPDLVRDGSFEEGTPNPFWSEETAEPTFLGPICDESCFAIDFNFARTGQWWAWLGNFSSDTFVSQTVFLDAGQPVVLKFYFGNIGSDPGGDDRLEVYIDDQLVFQRFEFNPTVQFEYELVNIDLSDFADGQEHVVRFRGTDFSGNSTTFFVDDVSIRPVPAVAVPALSLFAVLVVIITISLHYVYFRRKQGAAAD